MMLREARPIELAPPLAPDLEDALEIVWAGRGDGAVEAVHLLESRRVRAREGLKHRTDPRQIARDAGIVVVVIWQRGRGIYKRLEGDEQRLS